MSNRRDVWRRRRVHVALAVLCAVAALVLLVVAGLSEERTPWLAATVSFVSASSIWWLDARRTGGGKT